MHLMIGRLLRDTGLAAIVSQAEVMTSGRARSSLQTHEVCPPGLACIAVRAQTEPIRGVLQ